MTVAAVLMSILEALARAFGVALRERDEGAAFAAARTALLDSIAAVESAEARAKFDRLREP